MSLQLINQSNSRAIHYDENRWNNPEEFDPARYLNDPLSSAEAMTASNPDDRDHFTYGAGRRSCPGVHIAQNSLFINMARVLWAFNIKKAIDSNGDIIEPSPKTEQGFLAVPERFPCHFEIRSSKRAKIVEETWSKTEAEGLHWQRMKKTM